jgi:hypothetical protein
VIFVCIPPLFLRECEVVSGLEVSEVSNDVSYQEGRGQARPGHQQQDQEPHGAELEGILCCQALLPGEC